ncbi:MAG: SusC/RagA family TonB-linked outer membrane protein [Muribaculaceae bacterium]|nr:SusC/RagA family TonB-linked outer membrane protein [Muribaculaceae bacterium]
MNTKLHIGFTALALSLCSIPAWAQAEEQDSLVNIAFGKIDKRDVITASSFVNINDISKKNADNSPLSDVTTHVGGYNGTIWGQAPLVLIDGVPRDASMVKASEVESVSILKDAAAVALYGSRGAKGVVLITTKRGQEAPMKIDVRANVGAMLPKSYPKYLDAATYMNLYNEACVNDGRSPLYDQSTIYNTAMGTNPYRYPDIDFYSSDYLRDFVTTADITGEVYGGTEKTKYYLNLGVDYTNNLLKYGEHNKSNNFNFNVRGNVDMTIAKWLTATTNAAIIISDNYSGRGDFWGAAANLRPNWFSPWLPVSMMDPNNASIQDYINTSTHLIGGQYLLGGTTSDQTNAFSEALAAGYTRQKYRKFLFDLTLNADLSGLTKGLSFKGAFSVDYNAHYSEAYAQSYAVYKPTWANVNGQDMIIGLDKINEDKSSTNEYVGQSTYNQTMMFSAQFDYARSFADAHNVNATLVGWGYQQNLSADDGHASEGGYHRPSNVNAGLRVNYNYKHRYFIDLTGTVVHSSKLPEGNRNAFSPAVSVAWNLANENFMESSHSWLDELKIMGSYANLHQDLDINDWYLYKADYQFNPGSGWYQWADGTVGGSTSTSKRGANDELTFITRKEFRVGLDATFLNGLINVNANWFNQTTNGLLTQGASTLFPSFYSSGTGNFLPYINYNKDERTGFDYTVNINKQFGDWDLSLGLVGMKFNSKAKLRDEVWEEDYLYRQGHALDASWGYVCEGFFQSEAEIASSPKQSFGGTVRPGDLKYKDINNDGVIDSKDQVDLGKMGWSSAPYVYGINLTAKYKHFTLYLSGTGVQGAKFYKSDGYYWLRGTSKFSEMALNRWTPETAATATFPRLTTENGDNNYQNSTFWLAKGDSFSLKNLQLTYDFTNLGKCFIHGISVYAGAYNLFTISKEREHLERSLYGPQYRTVYIGCKLNM